MNKIGLGLLSLVLIIAIGRICWINMGDRPEGYPVEQYNMGEWVELDGAFFSDATESTDGYSIKVTGAELMSCDEFIKQYGKTDTLPKLSSTPQSVVAIEYEVRNEGNSDGAILLFMHELIPERKNAAYECDADLWNASQPQLGGTMGFTVKEGTTYSFTAPFTLLYQPDYFETYDNMKRAKIEDTSFELVVSRAPVQKVINVNLSE